MKSYTKFPSETWLCVTFLIEEKVLDKPIESTSLELLIEQCSSDGSIVRSKCDGRKQLEQVDGLHDGQQIRYTSRNHYPEVEQVFSKDEPKNKLHNVEVFVYIPVLNVSISKKPDLQFMKFA